MGTIDLRVDYLRPGRGERFTATSTLLRAGNKVAVARVELHNEAQVYASATATYGGLIGQNRVTSLFGNGFYRWMRNRRGWDHSGPRRLLYLGYRASVFKLIYYVPADEILTHRVIWSFFFMVALISVSRQWPQVKKLLKTPRKIFLLALSAVLVGGNWLLFIWAVNNHHMLEASLGYFINPLVNILLG